MHDARAVANWLIDKAIKDENPLTPLQIIKLVYFAHGWTLAFFGRSLFRQPVAAWRYGPVIADVYYALKHYRGNPVDHVIPGIPEAEFDAGETDVLEQVYEVYGDFSGLRLSALTHHDGSPWDKTFSRKFRRKPLIDNDLIRSHFKELADAGG